MRPDGKMREVYEGWRAPDADSDVWRYYDKPTPRLREFMVSITNVLSRSTSEGKRESFRILRVYADPETPTPMYQLNVPASMFGSVEEMQAWAIAMWRTM